MIRNKVRSSLKPRVGALPVAAGRSPGCAASVGRVGLSGPCGFKTRSFVGEVCRAMTELTGRILIEGETGRPPEPRGTGIGHL